MSEDEAIERVRSAQASMGSGEQDAEGAHREIDAVIIEALREAGWDRLAAEYESCVHEWFWFG